ncbi:MAG: serine O-acetyltransferase [Candidatus Methylopumilus sp.]|jgi:serine O-acetyltransferase
MFKKIREDIAIVFERDPAARSTLEVLTTYPGVHALLIHRLSHAFWQIKFYWLGRMLSHIGRWFTGIEIHPGATIGRRVFIDHGMGVVIGETAIIEDDCTLYHGVTLGGTSWNKGKRHPTLKQGVVIGAGAKILGPITIGRGAKIGSNAVVVKDVPAKATAVGIPARIVEEEGKTKQRSEVQLPAFNAYAVGKDEPDPVHKNIDHLMSAIKKQNQTIERLEAQIKALKPRATEDLKLAKAFSLKKKVSK